MYFFKFINSLLCLIYKIISVNIFNSNSMGLIPINFFMFITWDFLK